MQLKNMKSTENYTNIKMIMLYTGGGHNAACARYLECLGFKSEIFYLINIILDKQSAA
jgi:hypothetical protein